MAKQPADLQLGTTKGGLEGQLEHSVQIPSTQFWTHAFGQPVTCST